MRTTLVRQAVVALALGAAGFAANALPTFTLNATQFGGSTINADNILISDFSRITLNGNGTFSETGLLQVTSFQLGTSTFTPTGLNTSYGLYIKFDATGTVTNANPSQSVTNGNFSTLNYTLFGYTGAGNFGVDASGNPFETANGEVALASGSLIGGSLGTRPSGSSFSSSADANLTLNVASGQQGFFVSPNPFYNVAISSFTNSFSQVSNASAAGFSISQGGGSINFASAVPEPETYALMLAGLGVVGFVARRRQQAK